jgi:hypothetical protein
LMMGTQHSVSGDIRACPFKPYQRIVRARPMQITPQ